MFKSFPRMRTIFLSITAIFLAAVFVANGPIGISPKQRFHARDLNLIMGPAGSGSPLKFRALIDGKPPGTAHGLDIDVDGNGTVTEPRMYQLIRQQDSVIDREFQIEFLDQKVEVYDFTFG